MEQSASLSKEEILWLRKQYKIDKELAKVHKWLRETAEKVEKEGLTEKDDPELRAKWARVTFKKFLLEKMRKHMFCPECIPEHERKKIGELFEFA